MPNEVAKTVLVVDDEDLFLRTVADGFAAEAGHVKVLTAENGLVAATVLADQEVDLVVTDLKMPEMDGFELVAHMSRCHPKVPVIVMTAFGTPEIESSLGDQGVLQCLEKPLDFPSLRTRVFEGLAASADGYLRGISLPTFLQMIEADRKTCTLNVQAGERRGALSFNRGELVDAQAGSLLGDDAALEIVCWEQPEIEVLARQGRGRKKTKMALQEVLLEGFRRQDESRREQRLSNPPGAPGGPTRADGRASLQSTSAEVMIMSAGEKLKELSALEGFSGAAVYTPVGEALCVLPGEVSNLKDIGVLANQVLLNAQKASLEMGTGRGQQVHVEAQHAHILARCLNEGTDPVKSQPGKAHIHMVVVLKQDAPIGMAKMRINSVIERMGEDFRG